MTKIASALNGKRAAVLGLGLRSGVPLVRFLLKEGAHVTALDKRQAQDMPEVLALLEGLEVELRLGEDYLADLKGFDLIFKTPVMRPDLPELSAAVANGAIVTSEIELFCELCPVPITAVTGSDGKTTTTSLIAAVFREAGAHTYLGGNIGNSLIEQVEKIEGGDRVVLELSSFQLMPMRQSPHVAVITNISPNHLDVHKSYEEYIAAKANIWRYQQPNDVVILNYDDVLTRNMAASAPGRAVFFSRLSELAEGVFWREGHLIARWQGREERICQAADLKLRGVHNQENIAAAAAACLVQDVPVSVIAKAVTEFATVEHRLELVRELNGVKYYNDSIASSPTRTIAGLAAIGGDIVLIAGGSDKQVPFDELARVIVERVRAVALIGKTAQKISQEISLAEHQSGRHVKSAILPSLAAAVEWCQTQTLPGSSVMLSPACASFDMFRDFEDRGRQFKAIVRSL
ncbi:MAG: UDP-N-acetylmuramoylalanine--D-glutamate ligase [Firmicutes bacterium]|nr:UDP-N-acetylmuramoylalanine--D-glutamate ligase [candidate division NPL-UPA2 bacterium]